MAYTMYHYQFASGVRPAPIRRETCVLARGVVTSPRLVAIALLMGLFAGTLDSTAVNLALSSIQASLKTDLVGSSWVVTIYTLMAAALFVVAGRWADQFGRKRMFILSLILFALGSALCASAASIWWLIGARLLQAVGASCISTTSLALITSTFPRRQRAAAVGVWGGTTGLAATIGPVVGGFLTYTVGWRWIFWSNIPLCLVSLVLVAYATPEIREQKSKRTDVLGLITLSLAIFSLTLAILQGNSWGWTSGLILSLLGGTLVSIIVFILVECRQQDPLVDLSLFKKPNFLVANLSIFLFGGGFQGALLILPLYFQHVRGYSELDAAYAISPISLTAFAVSIGATWIGPQAPRMKGIIGLVLVAVGLGLLYCLPTQADYLDIIWRGAIAGAGIGLCFSIFPVIALSDVPRTKLSVGSGVFNTFRLLGFTLGVAVLISSYSGSLQSDMGVARTHSVAIVRTDTRLPASMREGLAAQLSAPHPLPDRTTIMHMADDEGTQKQALLPELAAVSDRLQNEVQQATTLAFLSTWLLAALLSGISVAFVLLIIGWYWRHRRRQRAAAWQAEYFFSTRGVISPGTIRCYLTASRQSRDSYPCLQMPQNQSTIFVPQFSLSL